MNCNNNNHLGFFCLGGDAEPNIVVVPNNTAGHIGSTVTLYCTWRNTGIGKVQWFNHVGGGSGIRITDNENIIGDVNKYGLTGNHGSGEYNLQIKSLTDSDVGDYACFTQLNNVRYGAYVLLASKSIKSVNCFCFGDAFYICRFSNQSSTIVYTISQKIIGHATSNILEHMKVAQHRALSGQDKDHNGISFYF